MKDLINKIICLAMLLATASCDVWQIRMDTEVFRDGSCQRTVWADSDTCLTRDEGWQRSEILLSRNEAKDLLFRHTSSKRPDTSSIYIKRTFAHAGDMSASPAVRIYGEPLRSEVTLTRKFKWFYTDYTFTEMFHGWDDHLHIPVTDYLTCDEATFMLTGYPELPKGTPGVEIADYIDDLSDKMNHWDRAWQLDIAFKVIANHYDDIANPPVDRETFLSKFREMAGDDETWKRTRDLLLPFKRISVNSMVRMFFKEFFHSDAYAIFFNSDNEKYRLYWNEANAYYIQNQGIRMLNMPYRLKMPGRVTDPGRGTVTDGVISYTLKGAFLIPDSYTITASSRAVNVWAFAISLLVVALALGSFFIRCRK